MITNRGYYLIFYQILSTSLSRRCMENSLENLYVDIGSQRIKTTVNSLWHSYNMHKVSVFERRPVTREPNNKPKEWQSRSPLFLGRCPSILTPIHNNMETLSYDQLSDPSDWNYTKIVGLWWRDCLKQRRLNKLKNFKPSAKKMVSVTTDHRCRELMSNNNLLALVFKRSYWLDVLLRVIN